MRRARPADDARPWGRIIAVEGPSGAGKSTLVREASRRFGWTALAEAYDRIKPPPDLAYRSVEELDRIERRLLREELKRYREARRRRADGEVVIADTGFLGPLTYTAGLVALGLAPERILTGLERLVPPSDRSARWGLPDQVVYLDVGARERRARAKQDPVRHPPFLMGRHESVGVFERRYYRQLSIGELAGHVHFVRSGRPPPRVAERVRELVTRSHPRTPPTVRAFQPPAAALRAQARSGYRRRLARAARHR
jgi:hypothetical protein